MNFKTKFIKKVLKRTIKEKEDNLVRIKFDWYYAYKRYQEEKDKLPELEKEKAELEKKVEQLRSKPRTTQKKKQQVVELEGRINQIMREIDRIRRLEQEAKNLSKVFYEGAKLIKELKRCYKNPKVLYYDYETD